MTSRNKREGFYAGYWKSIDENANEKASRHHRVSLNALSLKHIYEPPSDESVARATAKVLELINAQDLRKPVHPKPMTLDSNTVMEAVKRVMATHGDVIKALGNR